MNGCNPETCEIGQKVKRLEETLYIGADKPSILERMTKVEDRLASLDTSIMRLTSAINKVTMAVILAVVGALLKLVVK